MNPDIFFQYATIIVISVGVLVWWTASCWRKEEPYVDPFEESEEDGLKRQLSQLIEQDRNAHRAALMEVKKICVNHSQSPYDDVSQDMRDAVDIINKAL